MVEHLALHGAVDVDDVEAVWNRAALMERIDRVVVRHLAEHILLSFVERVADLEPCGGQGASDRVQVLHVEPCVVSRPGQVFAHLVVAVAVLGERLAQHLLLSDDVEHEVHAVHRRPVEERLVIIPVPERHRVRIGAEVERVPVLVVRVFEDFPADCRQALRHGQLGAEQRVVVDLAPVADGDPAVAGV